MFWVSSFTNDKNKVIDLRKIGMFFMYLLGDFNFFASASDDIEQSLNIMTEFCLNINVNPDILRFPAYLLTADSPNYHTANHLLKTTIRNLSTETIKTSSTNVCITEKAWAILKSMLNCEQVHLGSSSLLLSALLHTNPSQIPVKEILTRLKSENLNELPIGLEGIAGYILVLGQANYSKKLNHIIVKLCHEVLQRVVSFHGKRKILTYNNGSGRISPYLYDGISGFLVSLCYQRDFDTKKLISQFQPEIASPFCKSGCAWDGLAGLALTNLIILNMNGSSDQHPLRIIKNQLLGSLQYLVFRHGEPKCVDFNTHLIVNSYSRGSQSIFDIISLYLTQKEEFNK